MPNLLDTHTFIWFINGDKSISSRARKAIEEDTNANFVSIASIWEIAIKISLGKLQLHAPFGNISQQIALNGFQVLPITVSDTFILSDLPFHHRDPFDRMIIVQSITNNLRIISRDASFEAYNVEVFW